MNKKIIQGMIIGFVVLSVILGVIFYSYYVDKGDFIFEKQIYSNSEYDNIPDIVSVFENMLPNALNKDFNLPEDVFIKFKHCDLPRTYYDPDEKTVFYCYEFLEDSLDFVGEYTRTTSLHPLEKGSMVTGITFFFLYHELAHALIDVYELEVLGKQEDAADFFAILIIFSILKDLEGPSYGLSGPMALFFEDSKKYTYTEDLEFWDSHSLDAQRLYFILCFLYEKYGPDIFPEGAIDSEELEDLADCYLGVEKIAEDWAKLLKPHIKSDSTFLSRLV